MSLFERRNFLNGSEFGGDSHEGTETRKTVCNLEIWCECFCKEASSMKKSDAYEISSIMRKIEGWNRNSGKTGIMFPIYGKQRYYVLEQEQE